jgi:hypothetical protein
VEVKVDIFQGFLYTGVVVAHQYCSLKNKGQPRGTWRRYQHIYNASFLANALARVLLPHDE